MAVSAPNNLNSSMSKFIAGSSRPEQSGLNVPNNDYYTKNMPNPPEGGQDPFIADISQPDA